MNITQFVKYSSILYFELHTLKIILFCENINFSVTVSMKIRHLNPILKNYYNILLSGLSISFKEYNNILLKNTLNFTQYFVKNFIYRIQNKKM